MKMAIPAAEIDRLRADKDVIRSQERNAAYERDIAALEAEIERLREALKEYGRHDPTCHWFHPERYACDCGLHTALEQKSPP